MKAGYKFLIGALVIVGAVSFLMIEGVRQTGVYFLTPTELHSRTQADPTFYDVGIKVGAKVVKGSVVRSADRRRIDFRISDGTTEYPVAYTGTVPDTFTDANDIEVVVEGRLGHDGVLHATDVLAKCGSRYETAPRAA
jgi:cytochrome c-type biogenesis protein CcmE